MGHARYDQDDFRRYSQAHNLPRATTEEMFQQRRIHEMLDLRNIRVRESRDSQENPESTALCFVGDDTGSMGAYSGLMVKEGINAVMTQLYEKKPVTDPHCAFGVFGDLYSDAHPLQFSQFEADVRVVEQTRLAFLEGNGGGNNGESTSLVWYFLDRFTSIDCWEKRQKKGYCFTYSDEPCHPDLDPDLMKSKVFGLRELEGPFDTQSVKRAARQKWHLFHFIIAQGDYCRGRGIERVVESWEPLLHDRVIVLNDYRRMPDVAVALIQATEGVDRDTILRGYEPDIRREVERSISGLGRRIEV